MKRIALTDNSGRWFDRNQAKIFKPAYYFDGIRGEVCRATEDNRITETLFLAVNGTFILHVDYDGDPRSDTSTTIGQEQAARWLIANGHQDQLPQLELASEEGGLEC